MHHLKQSNLSFLHPTATQPIPISVINLHLASINLSKFFASATASAAASVNSVPFDKSISTKKEQFSANLRSPVAVKCLERERLIERSVDFQEAESEASNGSLTRGQQERSRWEIEG